MLPKRVLTSEQRTKGASASKWYVSNDVKKEDDKIFVVLQHMASGAGGGLARGVHWQGGHPLNTSELAPNPHVNKMFVDILPSDRGKIERAFDGFNSA